MASYSNDNLLARQAQRGDKEAFLALYDLYFQKVYRRVSSKIPPSYVEDVTQEVFIAVLRSIHSFEERARFSTWLYTIVSRQIADFYRRRGYQSEAQAVSLDQIAHLISDVPIGEQEGDQALIRKALNELPDHYQSLLLLRFADGLTFAEIADERGQSLEAVKSLYRRAIQALRERLGVETHES